MKLTKFKDPLPIPPVLQPIWKSGQYVWHCHMLEHEDYEMMRPYRVLGHLS